jgi:transcriptional regulator GlxA family with amidase domain
MRRIVFLAFDGVQSLDLTGPLEVFVHAARSRGGPAYETIVTSLRGGAVKTSSGLTIQSRRLAGLSRGRIDTVLVLGGNERGVNEARESARLIQLLRQISSKSRRVGSVCSGALILAQTGLLDGHRVATHWGSVKRLAELHKSLQVDGDSIYVQSGKFWSSAGVTAGIDMALAMVEEDAGRELSLAIAGELVLFARRLGFQSQFSDVLLAQREQASPLGQVLGWASSHLNELDVPSLAAFAGTSVRNFHRLCKSHAGTTPGKLIEQLRADHARVLLTTTSYGLKKIADECGFRDASTLTRSFTRRFGLPPSDYRRTHT